MASHCGERVSTYELSPELRERLRETIGSFEELQLLLHARRQPEPWTLEETARRLHLGDPPLGEAVKCLVRAGFLAMSGEESPNAPRFLYDPASAALAELADRLADALEHDPLHVFDLMNRHALDRLRTSAVRAFASAFVLGRKKDG